jgi:hypothetical protein
MVSSGSNSQGPAGSHRVGLRGMGQNLQPAALASEKSAARKRRWTPDCPLLCWRRVPKPDGTLPGTGCPQPVLFYCLYKDANAGFRCLQFTRLGLVAGDSGVEVFDVEELVLNGLEYALQLVESQAQLDGLHKLLYHPEGYGRLINLSSCV